MTRWRWIATIGFACAALTGCGDAGDTEAAAERERTRIIMAQIFGGLRVALPASVDRARFTDPERGPEIAAALDVLAQNAALLETHSTESEGEMHFLAGAVARDAALVQREYANGRFDQAAFLLRLIAENCVVCHTRLPSPEDSPLSAGFVDIAALAGLEPEARATLQIATRRFDDALVTLENLFASPLVHPALLLGPLTDYFVVCIRVKGDYERPVPVLQRFAGRDDLWTRLRMNVERWIAALPLLRERAGRASDLATARALLDESKRMAVFPTDRAGLVHEVAASAILERFIHEHQTRDRDLAEGYYLLGIIEARIGRNYWVTPAPYLLEEAIRLAPGEPFAKDAFALIERETLMSYYGLGRDALPEQEARRLAELQALLESD
jgi:hypothetical protein